MLILFGHFGVKTIFHFLKISFLCFENASLRELTASERLSLDEEYEMQLSWANDGDKCTFIVLSRFLFEQQRNEVNFYFKYFPSYLHNTFTSVFCHLAITL